MKINDKRALNNLIQMASFSLELHELGKYKDRELKEIYQHICKQLSALESSKVEKLKTIAR